MPDIRLVALDLDGTVFNDEKEITPRTLEAIRAAIAKGVDVIPATGRVASGVPEAFLRIPGVRYALTSNGASVVELSTGKPLVNLPFDAALASDIYDIVAATGGAMGIFIGGKAYTDYFGANDGLALMPPALRRYLRDSRIVVDDMHAVFAAHPHEVEKFSITYRDNAARDAAWQAVASRFNVEITSSIPNNMEINAPATLRREFDEIIVCTGSHPKTLPVKGFNKTINFTQLLLNQVDAGDRIVFFGGGLLALAEKLGLRRDQVMAVGDSGNDLAMIQAAGYGIAMGNATPDVLAAARYVTDDNNHDGVAKAIETYVLKG